MNRFWTETKRRISGFLMLSAAFVLQRRGYVFRLVKESLLRNDILHSLTEDQRLVDRLSRNQGFVQKLSRNQAAFDKITEDEHLLNRLAKSEKALQILAKHGWLQRAVDFERCWQKFSRQLAIRSPENPAPSVVSAQLNLHAANKLNLREAILAIISDENFFYYGDISVRHSDRKSLWILINEILVNEDYYFNSNTPGPRVLDCGCHFGLATLYLKRLYPNAKVTAFEPIPDIFALARQNFESCGLSDVTLLPYALSNEEKTATFYVPLNNPMGSSLDNRYENTEDVVTSVEVQCKRLSSYLTEPVDFLKLDIEGAEHLVLEEAKSYLYNVHFLFVEVHIIDQTKTERLSHILRLLEHSGFDIHCNKSWTSHAKSERRPLDFVHEPLTHVVWARNRNFVGGS